MKIDCIAVCGDSFATGSGLPPENCYEDMFGGIISKTLNLPMKVYARSGCCNFSIFLQVKKIIEQFHLKEHTPLVIVSLTHHSRLLFPIDGTKLEINLNLSNLDYLNYHPYSEASQPRRPLEFKLDKDPQLISETISNIGLCLSGHHMAPGDQFVNIMERKWEALRLYFEELYDDGIKREYDNALALMMHNMLVETNLPHVIMGFGKYIHRFIDQKNFADIHWGSICLNHPDRQGSGHCDETGHMIVANTLLPICQEQLS
jgi:hypothetical protein